jgi:hypothetical protein
MPGVILFNGVDDFFLPGMVILPSFDQPLKEEPHFHGILSALFLYPNKYKRTAESCRDGIDACSAA